MNLQTSSIIILLIALIVSLVKCAGEQKRHIATLQELHDCQTAPPDTLTDTIESIKTITVTKYKPAPINVQPVQPDTLKLCDSLRTYEFEISDSNLHAGDVVITTLGTVESFRAFIERKERTITNTITKTVTVKVERAERPALWLIGGGGWLKEPYYSYGVGYQQKNLRLDLSYNSIKAVEVRAGIRLIKMN